MKTWKKLTSLLLALMLSVPCALFASCDKNGDEPNTEQNGGNENNQDNNDNQDGDGNQGGDNNQEDEDEEGDENSPKLYTPTLTMSGNVAKWKKIKNADYYLYKRGENGNVKRTDGTHVTLLLGQTLYVMAVNESGEKENSDWATISYDEYKDPYIAPPAWAANPTIDEFYDGNGEDFNRYEGFEGYYRINLVAGETKYYSFAIDAPGQYALVTNVAKSGLKIERCDASAHYIAPTTYPAQVLEGNTLYSYVHCSGLEYSAQWRATYKISSSASGDIIIRFVRVGDALPTPTSTITDVAAKEIVGKAQSFSSAHVAKPIPWTTEDKPQYFYDKDYEMTFNDLVTGDEKTAKGFYRMGTAENPGDVIYVAINATPERYLGASFSTIQYTGDNLTLYKDMDEDCNYYYDSYVDFIMNNGGEMDNANGGTPVEGDPTLPCYTNAANKDGMYPVNQELFDFLNTYVALNPPSFEEGVTVDKKDYWLAPCYYYVEEVIGSKNNPILLEEGENTIVLEAKKSKYYKLNLTPSTTYTLVGSNGLIAYFNEVNYGNADNPFPVSFDVTIDSTSNSLLIECKSPTAGEYTLTISSTPIVDEEATE